MDQSKFKDWCDENVFALKEGEFEKRHGINFHDFSSDNWEKGLGEYWMKYCKERESK